MLSVLVPMTGQWGFIRKKVPHHSIHHISAEVLKQAREGVSEQEKVENVEKIER